MASDIESGKGSKKQVYDFEPYLKVEKIKRVANFISQGWLPERQFKLLSKLYADYLSMGESALDDARVEKLIQLYGPNNED
jgi:hypothetical protein